MVSTKWRQSLVVAVDELAPELEMYRLAIVCDYSMSDSSSYYLVLVVNAVVNESGVPDNVSSRGRAWQNYKRGPRYSYCTSRVSYVHGMALER